VVNPKTSNLPAGRQGKAFFQAISILNKHINTSENKIDIDEE